MLRKSAFALLAAILSIAILHPPLATAGAGGYALWFDGTDDEVVIPHHESISFSAPPEAMTIEFWFKRGGPRSGVYHLLGKRAGCGDLNYNIGVEGANHDVVSFATAVGGSYVVHFAPLTTPDTIWTHVSFTADGSEIRMYVNGELVTAEAGIVSKEVLSPLKMGQSGTCGASMRLVGWMDEVRIWSVARTGDQIRDNYGRPVDPGSTGLVGYWNFDEDSTDQQVRDLSPLGNHGTLGADGQPGADDPTRVPSTVPWTCLSVECPYAPSDVNCDGISDVRDVVAAVNVAFRGTPAAQPCCKYGW